MWQTKRLGKPIVLLALTWALAAETGCTAKPAHTAEPPGTEPIPSGSMTGAPGGAGDTVAIVGETRITRRQLLNALLDSYGEQTVRMMMLRVAVQKETEADGISISDEAVERELRKASEGYGSLEAFYAARQDQLGMSREDVRKDLVYKLQLEALAIRGINVTETDVDHYMSDHPEAFAPRSELKLSHIVVEKQKDAERLLGLLEQGEDFAQLAASDSKDAETAEGGGDLGWVESDDPFVAPELLEAASKLEIGEAAGPIRTDAGYEIVLLSGRRDEGEQEPQAERDEAKRQYALSVAPSLSEVEQSLLDKYGARVLDGALQF
ncbi:peptidylprolyl isomerase [Cohnella sp. JJ-181]|uniref:peptidylprolyl isomerase n=1 Tax=Cohnella rhizoplanae TaxID=2974897 RepID=UPI0022FF8CE2|nr:peptidylprolyl isomerase [Cohnella sp. JJ-181]CAI6084627.1 Foldase protein PrsA [Cohnella sp. JJ-181]